MLQEELELARRRRLLKSEVERVKEEAKLTTGLCAQVGGLESGVRFHRRVRPRSDPVEFLLSSMNLLSLARSTRPTRRVSRHADPQPENVSSRARRSA